MSRSLSLSKNYREKPERIVQLANCLAEFQHWNNLLLILWLLITKTPGEIIVGGVSMFAGITDTFINLRSMSFRLIQNLPPYLPPILLIFTLGWGMIISLIWGLTIWRFSQRGVEQK